MSLKQIVNNHEVWDSLNQELDRRLNHVHIQMDQTLKAEDLFRLQGEATSLRKLKFPRNKVN